MKLAEKNLTVREKIMICVLLLLVVCVAYYYAVYNPVKAQLAQLDEERYTMETELMVLETQNVEIVRLQKELEQLQADAAAKGSQSSVPDYDNFNAMMDQLNLLMKGTTEYSMNFGTVDMSQSIVRRPITMSFKCNSYESAKNILKQLAMGPYRCQISDLAMTASENGRGINKGGVTVAVTVTYFEMKTKA